eukprot:CAMPEP_0198109088 /NCGR_PEP_ID=MMETSP1442-20131203/1106_1 /TAXON_ID= /ORGANISM="Craspedostauros australis, Strain CCMP3328" /LENGTH=230 /DNA_ID=CAMNT_0043764587 /DNA_START=51 /DNA_END=743 /DNA_ORIENTATION=-
MVTSAATAFSVGSPTSGILLRQPVTSTCLWAEKAEETSDDETIEAGDDASSATDILNSPAFLQRKLEVLETDIKKADEDIAEAKERLSAGKEEWQDQLDKLEVEYKTIKDRMSAQTDQNDVVATSEVASAILELVDNFERGFGIVIPETDEEKAIDEEYRKVHSDILATLEKLGVKQVETVGKEFDYEVHQAVMQRASEEYEENIICEEYQKGFVIGEKLIRPAMVAVAA